MKTEAFFAAVIRGALIGKTGAPWVVTAASLPDITEDAKLSISFNSETEAEKQIPGCLEKSTDGKIPAGISVDCGGTKLNYLIAPDMAEMDKMRSQNKTAGWNTANCRFPGAGFGESRSLVVKNRIALVTGGAQGFGEEISRGLVSAGALVFIADLNLAGAARLAESLNGEYGRTTAIAVEVNVADEASVEKMTETIALTAGGLDLCVSNAGVLRAAPVLEQDIASFKFVTDINYTAFTIITKHCGLLMRAQNLCAQSLRAPAWTTDIIQINSKSGLEGSNKNGAYAGSKFGSIGLVQSFAKELVDYGIKVNAVCPGNFFDGPLWADPEKGLFVQYLKTGKVPGAKTIADVKAFYEAKVPMGRGCTGPDVIRAILYLVEQEYETGQALPVTGGQVMLS